MSNTNINLDAVKDYIAENGILKFISYDWLQNYVAEPYGIDLENNDNVELVDIVRKELNQYSTFESLYNDVLMDGINQTYATKMLDDVGQYLSDDDRRFLDYSYQCFVK